MKKYALTILTVLFLCSYHSFAKIHYVSNQGSEGGDGSFTNPFNKISTAYNAAVSNGQNEVIKLFPGNYYQTNTLIFDNENITISGYGDGSVIQDDIIVKSDMSFADLYIQSSFSNEEFVVFNNVKCDDSNIDIEAISGAWRDSSDIVHINSLIDPIDEMEAVNLDSMNAYVQGSLTTFVDESELVNEMWVENHVSNYVSENALLIKDGVVDLSGNIISNFGELFLHNDNCIATGVVHSSMSTFFDTHISCRPPAGVILQYVKFISGSWNGRIFQISTYGTPSWCGSAYYYYNIVTNGYVYIPSGLEFEIYGTDIAISEKFVDQAGDTMAGPLSINEIKMYSTIENGYLVTGCSYEDANGIYYQESYYENGGAQVYKNLNGIYMFRYYWTDGGESGYYWAFSDSLQDNITGPFPTPCYDYSISGLTTPPEEWNQSTVIGPTHQRAPVIDFAGGKGINLAECTETNDIATKGYVDDCFRGFDYDARFVYIDKYYDGRNDYKGTLQAPYTNFYHAYDKLGQASFYGASQPVVYHVGNGFYEFPPAAAVNENQPFKVAILGRGSYYRNVHEHLNWYGSTAFSELGTYIDEVYCARIDGTNNNANAILHLRDLVISNVYLYSVAHDEIYCDNVVFLNITDNGQQKYHGLYYTGQMDTNAHYDALSSSSIRPVYFDAIDATYVHKSGDTMSNLTVNGSFAAEEILLTESQNWYVGTSNTPGYIVMNNTNSAITTPETSSAPLRLITHNYKPVIIESGRLEIGPTIHPNGDEGGEIKLAADPDVGLRVTIDVINNNLRFYAVDEDTGDIRMYTLWKLNPTTAVGQADWTNGQWEVAADFTPSVSTPDYNPSYTLSTNFEARIQQLEATIEELQN